MATPIFFCRNCGIILDPSYEYRFCGNCNADVSLKESRIEGQFDDEDAAALLSPPIDHQEEDDA